jgi:hypothetical protein
LACIRSLVLNILFKAATLVGENLRQQNSLPYRKQVKTELAGERRKGGRSVCVEGPMH